MSWYQAHANRSLRLIEETGMSPAAALIDVGGGASTLVDYLLAQHYEAITVLDLSTTALDAAKARLGNRAAAVEWLEGDITQMDLPEHAYDVWHDRAVFHFTDRTGGSQRVCSDCSSFREAGWSRDYGHLRRGRARPVQQVACHAV